MLILLIVAQEERITVPYQGPRQDHGLSRSALAEDEVVPPYRWQGVGELPSPYQGQWIFSVPSIPWSILTPSIFLEREVRETYQEQWRSMNIDHPYGRPQYGVDEYC